VRYLTLAEALTVAETVTGVDAAVPSDVCPPPEIRARRRDRGHRPSRGCARDLRTDRRGESFPVVVVQDAFLHEDVCHHPWASSSKYPNRMVLKLVGGCGAGGSHRDSADVGSSCGPDLSKTPVFDCPSGRHHGTPGSPMG